MSVKSRDGSSWAQVSRTTALIQRRPAVLPLLVSNCHVTGMGYYNSKVAEQRFENQELGQSSTFHRSQPHLQQGVFVSLEERQAHGRQIQNPSPGILRHSRAETQGQPDYKQCLHCPILSCRMNTGIQTKWIDRCNLSFKKKNQWS